MPLEWLFGWGAFSYATTFKSTHPFANLAAEAVGIAFSLTIWVGMGFFQRWARSVFVVVLAVDLLMIPFQVHHYSLSASPSFMPVMATVMWLSTGAILAMSFLSPVRERFAATEA